MMNDLDACHQIRGLATETAHIISCIPKQHSSQNTFISIESVQKQSSKPSYHQKPSNAYSIQRQGPVKAVTTSAAPDLQETPQQKAILVQDKQKKNLYYFKSKPTAKVRASKSSSVFRQT